MRLPGIGKRVAGGGIARLTFPHPPHPNPDPRPAYGLIRKVPVFSPAETRVVTVTVLIEVTGKVVIGNVTSVAPAGTVTVLGVVE